MYSSSDAFTPKNQNEPGQGDEQPGLILIVDDYENNRRSLKRGLTRLGYEVILTDNGQDALELMIKNDIGLVLLDIMMPGMSGYYSTNPPPSIPNFKQIFSYEN